MMMMTMMMLSIPRILSLQLLIMMDFFVVSRAQDINNAIFFDCSLDDYYQDVLFSANGILRPTSSWDPLGISKLLRETHRQVLPYTSSSTEDVWDALIDLDSIQQEDGGGEETIVIDLIYRDVDVPALEYGTSENWNREHLWPKSRGVGTSGPDFTDVHHLRPSDWNVNSARSNLFFGDCEDLCTSRPAHSEAAADTARDANMFLPPAEVRGDIARALFYMAMRYSSFDEVNTEVLELTDCPDDSLAYQMAYLSDLLRWHEEDPPDEAERIRNERVCSRWQGNRNPFVDFPDLAVLVFGNPVEKPYDCDGAITVTPVSPPPVDDATVVVGCSQLSPGDVQVVSLSSDNPDSVVMVALTDLPAGLELFMTDNAWVVGSGFKNNEGTLKSTLTGGLGRGSIFGYGDPGSIPLGDSWESVGSGSFALATAGDSILIYCLDDDEENDDGTSSIRYHHLGGIITGTWTAANVVQEEIETNESQKPDALAKVGAIEIGGGWDNLMYVGTTTGTKTELLSALADSSNWEGSNTERFVFLSSAAADFVIEVEESKISNGNLSLKGVGDSSDSTSAAGSISRSHCYLGGLLLLAFWLF